MSGSAQHPYPPLHVARVPFADASRDPFDVYEQQGAETKNALVDLLPDTWSFEGKHVLDFGCGAGRTLRHFLAEAETGEFWGADIDDASIDWIQGALCPPLHARRCSAFPPLGFEDGSFDLVWAISVFTHLSENSNQWLAELHRLLKPGGLLIATYMGRWNSEFVAGEPWDENRVGMSVLQHNQDWDRGGPSVLMSDWWVHAHWGRAFEILELTPRTHNQTWALLRKRDLEITAEELERPEDDPREWVALRHNLHQVQREFDRALHWQREVARRERTLEVGQLRREYEDSWSWQVTRPLRAAGRIARLLRARREGRAG
jgi:SAM-dependent methyltransferase